MWKTGHEVKLPHSIGEVCEAPWAGEDEWSERSREDALHWLTLELRDYGFEGAAPDTPEACAELLNDSPYKPAHCHFGKCEGAAGRQVYAWLPAADLAYEFALCEVAVVNDTAELPADFAGEVAVISDHGNIDFGVITPAGRYKALWSCV